MSRTFRWNAIDGALAYGLAAGVYWGRLNAWPSASVLEPALTIRARAIACTIFVSASTIMMYGIGRLVTSSRVRSDLLACMNYEIRTPLNTARGLAQAGRRDCAGRKGGEIISWIPPSGQFLLGTGNKIVDSF
jgi:hypothetical protein